MRASITRERAPVAINSRGACIINIIKLRSTAPENKKRQPAPGEPYDDIYGSRRSDKHFVSNPAAAIKSLRDARK